MNIDRTNPKVKTGENPFRRFMAIYNQAGVAAPTLTKVLDNDLSKLSQVPTIARTGAGVYTFTLTGAFNGDFLGVVQIEQGATGLCAKIVKTSASVVTVGIFDAAGAAADLVGNMFIFIYVYDS